MKGDYRTTAACDVEGDIDIRRELGHLAVDVACSAGISVNESSCAIRDLVYGREGAYGGTKD